MPAKKIVFKNTSDKRIMLSQADGSFSMCVSPGDEVTVPARLKLAAMQAESKLKEAEILEEDESTEE